MGKGKGMIIEVTPFVVDCSDKEQACKVFEEAAEVFGAWQNVDFIDGSTELCSNWGLPDLADEIADVIQAACNLAERYGIDVAEAMERCTERQRARGRL